MLRLVAWSAAALWLLAVYMVLLAGSTPVERHLVLRSARIAAPLRLVLASDLHPGGPDTPIARIARLVPRIDALHPDLVLLAGDFVTDKFLETRSYSPTEAIAPLAGLNARLGTVAVLGNHDYWGDPAAIRAALTHAGVTVLRNQAQRFGPVTVGGVDDPYTHHGDLPRTLAAMRALGGFSVVMAHSPDIVPHMPADGALVLAGHTHCGQIALPLIGPLATASQYGRRYACGVIRERGLVVVVGAGIGTSLLPFRLGTRPDFWVIDLVPARI